MPYLFRIVRMSSGILLAAMIVSLFTGLMVIRYPLFPWISYSLVRDIYVFFILIVLIPALYLHSLGGIMMFLNRNGLAKTRIGKGSVIAGWAAVFLAFGLVYSLATPVPSLTGPGMNVSRPGGPGGSGSPGVALTPAEIAAHRSAGSCWVTIGGRVYDLTGFLCIHPGGAGAILPYCGKDGSTAYGTKNIGSSHSSYAVSLLNLYFIGDPGTTVNVTAPPGAVNPPQVRGGEREGGDD